MMQSTQQKRTKIKNPCFPYFCPNFMSLICYFILQTNINSSLLGVLMCIFPKKEYSEHQFPQDRIMASENQVSTQWVCFLSIYFSAPLVFQKHWYCLIICLKQDQTKFHWSSDSTKPFSFEDLILSYSLI